MALTYPRLKVRVPEHGERVLTVAELDGKMIPATRVAFDTGDMSARDSGLVKIRLEFVGSIDFESEAPMALTAIEGVESE